MSKVLTAAEPTRRFSGRKARIAKKLDEKPPAARKGKRKQAASLIEGVERLIAEEPER